MIVLTRPRRAAIAVGVCVLLALAAAPATRGQVPAPPPAYALLNARIMPMAGPPIDAGTLVMREGRIAAVGADVVAPPDAIAIDAAGWTLYPGFVDAHSTLGMMQDRDGAREERASPSRTANGTEGPDAMALTRYDPSREALGKARGSGLTAAHVASGHGLFARRGTVVALRDGDVDQLVLRDSWGQHVRFDPFDRESGRYPGTLMGVVATVRQGLSDAVWYAQAWEHYRNAPDTYARPEHDGALAALGPAATGDQPVVLSAWTENEILRARALAAEAGLDAARVVVSGAVEGWRVAEQLADSAGPVLVSLDLRPRREAAGFGRAERGPVDDPPAADAADAEANPGRLHAAGVRFALTSLGLADHADLLPNLRKVVRAGLPPEAALEALTRTPAAILGVADRLGSLEVGKAAHVIAVEGDLFADDGRIAAAWIDGEHYDLTNRQATSRRSRSRDHDRADADRDGDRDRRQLMERRAPAGPLWPEAPATAIRHATILTVANGTIASGTILIRDGRIQAVGVDDQVDVPDGAREIDASGLFVMPGIVDARSHMAITGGGNESSESVTPEVRIADVINHRDPAIFRALAGGATTVNVLHGSANVIGGQNAVLKLRWGQPAAELFFEDAPKGVKFALGENPKRSNRATRPGQERRYPATRMGVEFLLRKDFADARRYQQARLDHEAARAGGEDPLPPRRDLRLEALADILDGRILVHAHSYRSDEILMLLRVAEDFGFRIRSLQHVLEGYKVADEIAAHGAGASTFADNWAYKMEALDAIPYNMALMYERGVSVSINSDSDERVRRLYVEAAKAVKYGGVSEAAALEMITLAPAGHLGIADRVGSIEVGKDADLAIFTAHPFSAEARVQYTFVDGQVYFDRARVETTADAPAAALAASAAAGTGATRQTTRTRTTRRTPPLPHARAAASSGGPLRHAPPRRTACCGPRRATVTLRPPGYRRTPPAPSRPALPALPALPSWAAGS